VTSSTICCSHFDLSLPFSHFHFGSCSNPVLGFCFCSVLKCVKITV
jgi:hypothetical protein